MSKELDKVRVHGLKILAWTTQMSGLSLTFGLEECKVVFPIEGSASQLVCQFKQEPDTRWYADFYVCRFGHDDKPLPHTTSRGGVLFECDVDGRRMLVAGETFDQLVEEIRKNISHRI
ncbi:hypothetical protein D3C87_1299200 [compost metagenome]